MVTNQKRMKFSLLYKELYLYQLLICFVVLAEGIFGIWFYDREECQRLATLLNVWVLYEKLLRWRALRKPECSDLVSRPLIDPNFGEAQALKQDTRAQSCIRLRGNKDINVNYYFGCSPRVACPPSLAHMYLFHLLSSYFALNYFTESTRWRKGVAINKFEPAISQMTNTFWTEFVGVNVFFVCFFICWNRYASDCVVLWTHLENLKTMWLQVFTQVYHSL